MEIFPHAATSRDIASKAPTGDIVSPASRGRARACEAGILPTPTAVRYVPRSIPCYDITLVYRLNAVVTACQAQGGVLTFASPTLHLRASGAFLVGNPSKGSPFQLADR